MSLLVKLQVGKNESFFTVQWFFKKKSQEIVETHFELMVVANVAEENIYNARRIMQREIRYSCEKAGLGTPCKE